jgi:very-short-patch-repair endonuclease
MKKTNRLLPYDFVIEDMKLIIEIDGEQHFSQVPN